MSDTEGLNDFLERCFQGIFRGHSTEEARMAIQSLSLKTAGAFFDRHPIVKFRAQPLKAQHLGVCAAILFRGVAALS